MIDRNAFRASRSQRRVLGLVAASCLLSPAWLVAQRVWVVDKFQRAGFDAATIQAAVDAASSGDVIHVRFTTTSYLDRYAAPTIQGKGLTIAPEPGGARPTIVGQWNIQGVPNRLTITGFDLIGGSLQFMCTDCPGVLSFEDLQITQSGRGIYLANCGLVTIRGCSQITEGAFQASLYAEGSALEMTDSLIENRHYTGGQGGYIGLDAYQCRITLIGSTVRGASATSTLYPYACYPALDVCSCEVLIGAGSSMDAGRYLDGSPTVAVASTCGNRTNRVPTHFSVDWGATNSIGSFPSPGPYVVYHDGVQTGLSVAQTATTLQVTQHSNPPSLTVLAMGGLTTTPWTNVVGPVFVDPNGILGYFDPSSSGPVQRSFAIPPGLPAGTCVALQAFELTNAGRIVTSNVCVAGIW